ncbi:MAG: hypothetical protein IKK82_13135 [Kiritimatiellae bacterium]|nr:hypothetical protein [Kiritimatiellia bacterium]
MFKIIKELLGAFWNLIQKFFVAVCDFARNVRAYFMDSFRRSLLNDGKRRVLAVSIKERLDTGNYQLVHCLYDQDKNTVVDAQDMEVITAEELDSETQRQFGDDDILILG